MAPTHWMGLRDLFTRDFNTIPVFLRATHTTCFSICSEWTHHKGQWRARSGSRECDTVGRCSTCFHGISIISRRLDIQFAFPPHISQPSFHVQHSFHISPDAHCSPRWPTACFQSRPMHHKSCTTLYHNTPQHIQHCPHGQELSHVSLLALPPLPCTLLRNSCASCLLVISSTLPLRSLGVRECLLVEIWFCSVFCFL